MAELAQMRQQLNDALGQLSETRAQLNETQSQLGETRTQLSEAIERAASAMASQPSAGERSLSAGDETLQTRLAAFELERHDLEAELELLRTRATELQVINNQQRQELVEQRADVAAELRQLRELLQERGENPIHDSPEETLVNVASREKSQAEPDPVVSSVMAQFARLQKDVAQRRKKK
jgi:chromosome segregation ATPase